MSASELAQRFHEAYERLAPSFGYETRTETRAFDPETSNGRLMIAVCAELLVSAEADARTLAIKMMEEHAAHIKENAQALRKYPDTEQEARARELAGMFLTECAISLKMDKQLADVNEFLKRIAESDAAMDKPR